jgi:hypothetical protein
MNENLIYEINGKRYIIFEPVCTKNNVDLIQSTIKQYGGILQGIISLGRHFFKEIIKFRVLIPEESAIQFSNFLLSM